MESAKILPSFSDQEDNHVIKQLKILSNRTSLLALLLSLTDIGHGLLNGVFFSQLWLPTTAFALLLSAGSILLPTTAHHKILTGLVLLFAYAILINLLPDSLQVSALFFDSPSDPDSGKLKFYVWGCLISLLLTGACLITLFLSKPKKAYLYGQTLACLLFLFAYVCLLAFIVGKTTFPSIASFSLLPPTLALSLLSLSLSLLLFFPNRGLPNILSSIYAGSQHARKAFIGMLLSPLLAGLCISLLLVITSLSPAFGLVCFFVLYFVASLIGGYLNFLKINHFDQKQQELHTQNRAMNAHLKQANMEMATLNEELTSMIEEYNTVNEQLQKANQEIQVLMDEKLSKSEEKFKELTQSITDLFLALDQDLTYVYWNQACETLLGLPASQVIGKKVGQIEDFFAYRENKALFEEALLKKQPVSYEYDTLLKDNKYSFEVSVFPSNLGLSILVKDITDKKSKQQHILQLNQDLTDRNFELDQIVYKISHDIRSPLTSVLGLVNLLKMQSIEQQSYQYVAMIESSVLKLDGFTKAMLDFSKSARSGQSKGKIDIALLIESCKEDLSYMPHFARLQFALQVKGEDFYCDRLRIKIILQNIIANAVKYQSLEKESSYLHIKVEVASSQAMIVFEDNGTGIEKAYLPRIFDMFFRASEHSQGSGLGLYIVKQTVEKLGGSIQVDSTKGEGTRTLICLPNVLIEELTEAE